MKKGMKLIVGIISARDDDTPVLFELEKRFGSIDLKSKIIPFDFTDYYSEEMGENLKRYWLDFERLISPEMITEIKLKTNKLEKKFSRGTGRTVNIDPGYLAPSKLVLPSTKDFSHRIYLNEGIYAEITLQFAKNKFQFLPWTYPDYKSGTFMDFIMGVREKLLLQLETV